MTGMPWKWYICQAGWLWGRVVGFNSEGSWLNVLLRFRFSHALAPFSGLAREKLLRL